jgi:L-glyceraldehyde 3-phosphate reductase
MAIAWTLRNPAVTSALIGVSRLTQAEDAVKALDRLEFSPEELAAIDRAALPEAAVNLWAGSSAVV